MSSERLCQKLVHVVIHVRSICKSTERYAHSTGKAGMSEELFSFPLYLTSTPIHYFRRPSIPQLGSSDELLERAIERRAKGLDVLVKVDGRNSALGDAFGRELEFLRAPSQPSTRVALRNISRTKELTL